MLYYYLFIILILLAVSALLSCSETAITRLNRSKIRYLAKEGSQRAGTVYNLLHHRHRLISTILIGNNIANIFASSMATALLISIIGDTGLIFASLYMSSIIIIFTEITPKQYALLYPEKVSLLFAPVIKWVMFILSPISVFVQRISNCIINILPHTPQDMKSEDTELEIKGAIDLHQSRGYFTDQQAEMVDNIFTINKMDIKSEIIPLNKTIMVDIDSHKTYILQHMLHHTYDNFPVYKDRRTNIIGIISLRDVFRLYVQNKDITTEQLLAVIREPYFVPSGNSLLDQILWFKTHKQQMAIVTDNKKQPIGIITMQDIAEDILHQDPVQKKASEADVHLTVQKDGSIIVPGSTKISDINMIYGSQLPEKTYTLTGFILQHQQNENSDDKKFVYGGLRIAVIKSTARKIQKVKITPLSAPQGN